MTILIGMAALGLDMGIAYNSKSKLQNAVDSVALAAVRELPITKAKDWNDVVVPIAKEYAALNGIDDVENDFNITALNVDRIPITNVTNLNAGDINGIQISKKTVENYYFAQVIGIKEGVISADATAELVPIEGARGLLPIAISETAFNYLYENQDEHKTIKFDGNNNDDLDIAELQEKQSGWRGAINFLDEDNKTADGGLYQESIIDGYDGVIALEDYVSLNPGVMTANDLPLKFAGHENCTFIDGKVYKVYEEGVIYSAEGVILNEVCDNCPRIATIPIISFEPTYDENGVMEDVKNKLVKVVGIATIWIEDVSEKIIEASVISDEFVVNGARAGYVENDYGVRAAKLVDKNINNDKVFEGGANEKSQGIGIGDSSYCCCPFI